jgi:two-component system chemotaxis response regulator CheY
MPVRVLIVDDASYMRARIREILTEGGFVVAGEAANGAEAVELCRALAPQLVTMDIVMPFKNGIAATREIKALGNGAVVVMCSALGQESLVMEAIEAGAADFIVKPFEGEEVLSVLRKALEAP